MSITKQINADMIQAMKAKDKVKLSTIRLLKTALMNEKIKQGHALSKDEELTVLSREKKQREESIAEFTKAKRNDLIAQTKQELKVVENYLPQPLSKAELEKFVRQTIQDVGAKSKADFGKVMKNLMPKVKGRANGKDASALVRQNLN